MSRFFLRICGIVALTAAMAGSSASAAGPKVKSVDLTLSNPADAAVILSVFQTKVGVEYAPAKLATDLQRLGLMRYVPAALDITFGPDGVAIKLTASESEQFPAIYVSNVEILSLHNNAAGNLTQEQDVRYLRRLNQQGSTVFRRRPLEYTALLRDVEEIESRYCDDGYLDAHVLRAAFEVEPDGQTARVQYQVLRGELCTIGKITVRTSGKLNPADVEKALRLASGMPWTKANSIQDDAMRCCGENGFLEAAVSITAEPQVDHTVNVTVDVREGQRIILRQAVVQGADELKDPIARFVTLKPGEPVKQSDVDAIEHAVEDMGVFSDVRLLWVPLRNEPEGRRDLVIRVTRSDRPGQPSPAEQLYYDIARKAVRLYNGQDACRSLRLRGWFTSGGRRIDVDAAIVRPDRARLILSIASANGGKPADIVYTKIGAKSACSIGPLGKTVAVAVPLCLRVNLAPPDFENRRPSAVTVSLESAPDSVKIGPRCSPVAVYYSRQAILFTQKPATLDNGVLVLPQQDGGTVRIAVSDEKLPKRITWLDAAGKPQAELDVEVNSAALEKDAAAWTAEAKPDAAGEALLAPILWMLQMPDDAVRLAEAGAAAHANDPAAIAARGLIRLASRPPKSGLADLRDAAKLSSDPACKMLLGEMFIRGKDFAEAAALFAEAAKSDAKPEPLYPADLLLASGLSLQSVAETLADGPPDYAYRAAVGRVVALIGMADYASGETAANDVLKTHPGDPHAVELLARCRLSQSKAADALAAIAQVKEADQTPQMDIYATMCHVWLGNDAKAAVALARAFRKSPATQNLLYLQDQAGEIHAHFKQAAARAAVARAYSKAIIGDRPADERAQLAAIVNDGFLLKSDVDAIVERAAEREQTKPEQMADLRQIVLNQLVEDMLVLRWATWRGIQVPEEDVYRSLQEDMAEAGAATIEAYDAMLRERGSNLLARSRDLREGLLKQAAFSLALTDKVRISPAQVTAFYKANPAEFTVPPTATMRMITLEFSRFNDKQQARDLAAALLKRVKEKPETFEQVAREYSQDPNAARGGLWDGVRQASLIEPLDKAVFALNPGEISAVLESTHGCHIVKLTSITPQRKRPLDEVAPQILRGMQQAVARQAVPAWLDQLKSESCVEIFK